VRFEISLVGRKWRFELLDDDGQVLVRSIGGYPTQRQCEIALGRLRSADLPRTPVKVISKVAE
jgi:hypothetical protein